MIEQVFFYVLVPIKMLGVSPGILEAKCKKPSAACTTYSQGNFEEAEKAAVAGLNLHASNMVRRAELILQLVAALRGQAKYDQADAVSKILSDLNRQFSASPPLQNTAEDEATSEIALDANTIAELTLILANALRSQGDLEAAEQTLSNGLELEGLPRELESRLLAEMTLLLFSPGKKRRV